MPRYATWLSEGMKRRNHTIEIWTAEATFFALPVPAPLKKWMGYIDQFLLFPAQVRRRLKGLPTDTLFVVTDHALGPWVPLVAGKKHIIHCHDFLAQRSALGQYPQNQVSKTGQKYQEYIRNGFKKGRNFISVSYKTQSDLHEFLQKTPELSEVVYNGVNPIYKLQNIAAARQELAAKTGIDLSEGYMLHVGGNQWYKNRQGVIHLYTAWRSKYGRKLPLLLIGEAPNEELQKLVSDNEFAADIHFLKGLSDNLLVCAYNGASVFVFPSLAEGFGWPIAEAMACGCPVITTGEAPMNEVGAKAAYYIPAKQAAETYQTWAKAAADTLNSVISLSPEQRTELAHRGIENVSRFDSDKGLDVIESIYIRALQ